MNKGILKNIRDKYLLPSVAAAVVIVVLGAYLCGSGIFLSPQEKAVVGKWFCQTSPANFPEQSSLLVFMLEIDEDRTWKRIRCAEQPEMITMKPGDQGSWKIDSNGRLVLEQGEKGFLRSWRMWEEYEILKASDNQLRLKVNDRIYALKSCEDS
mgnify:CR=1 FL=1